MIGRVKKMMRDRGFGFANQDGEDLFFHRANFMDPKDYDVLLPGDLIDYKIQEDIDGRRQAVNIIFAKSGGGL